MLCNEKYPVTGMIERNFMRKLALSDELLLKADKASRYIGG